MKPFTNFESRVVAMPINNIDTDQIIPARFLKTTSKTGLDKNLFYDWRYDAEGKEKPDFILNQPAAKGVQVLLAGDNFGCGSSREHAPLSIKQNGIACVVAQGFARIFYRNAVNIGLPVIRCPEVYDAVQDGDEMTVDVRSGVITSGGRTFAGEAPSGVALTIMEHGSLLEMIKSRGWAALEEARVS